MCVTRRVLPHQFGNRPKGLMWVSKFRYVRWAYPQQSRCEWDKSCASAKSPVYSLTVLHWLRLLQWVMMQGATRTKDHQSLHGGPGSKWQQRPELGKGPPPTCILYHSITTKGRRLQLYPGYPRSPTLLAFLFCLMGLLTLAWCSSEAATLENVRAFLSWDRRVPACSLHVSLLHPSPCAR